MYVVVVDKTNVLLDGTTVCCLRLKLMFNDLSPKVRRFQPSQSNNDSMLCNCKKLNKACTSCSNYFIKLELAI